MERLFEFRGFDDRIDRLAIDWSRERDGCRSRSGRSRCRGDVDDDVDVPCVDVVDDASNWMDFCLVLLVELQIDAGSMLELIASLCERWC